MFKRLPFVLLCAMCAARAQVPFALPPNPSGPIDQPKPEPKLFDRIPEKPSLSPSMTIPVRPLGFSAPGALYLLRRQSLVSLDFVDDDRLLFTFHVFGLLSRDSDGDSSASSQQIRAVVVTLPEGKIESEARWTVPDRARYLWMLKDGHFLLRDSDGLELGDAELKMTPYMNQPGRLLWVELDPSQQVMITNSLEGAGSASGDAVQGSAGGNVAGAAMNLNGAGSDHAAAQGTLVIRTLQRDSGKLLQKSEVAYAAQSSDWPFNAEGYLESLIDHGTQWQLKFTPFAGGDPLVVVRGMESRCKPTTAYLTQRNIIVTTCDPGGGGNLLGMNMSGDHLWRAQIATNEMWPLLVVSADGSRIARETLALDRGTLKYKRKVGASDLRGQMVKIFDSASGRLLLQSPLSPVLDAGGNVAISPSGRRAALLNDGAIQVFDLPIDSPVQPAAASEK